MAVMGLLNANNMPEEDAHDYRMWSACETARVGSLELF
jgi:hypothetical protein